MLDVTVAILEHELDGLVLAGSEGEMQSVVAAPVGFLHLVVKEGLVGFINKFALTDNFLHFETFAFNRRHQS